MGNGPAPHGHSVAGGGAGESALDAARNPAQGTQVILRVLRVSLHLGFAALLLLGVVRYTLTLGSLTLGSGGSAPAWSPAVVYPVAALLAAVYLGGTAAEKRHALGASRLDSVTEDLPVQWQSASKAVNALVVGRAVQLGFLSLDDPVRKRDGAARKRQVDHG